TCTEENFMVKSGAQRVAAQLGLMLVSPDTSPRGEDVPDDPDGEYDFGLGAGFYLNATEKPWSRHYHMYDYVTSELQQVIFDNFPGDTSRHGLTGHSMGGHGALIIGLRNTSMFRSLSAFAPICTTLHSPWGRKALGNYLGSDTALWQQYDAAEIARQSDAAQHYSRILVDQGADDPFLKEQLQPELLEAACKESGLPLDLRIHEGYDHGYYFISTFIEEHLRFHAAELAR
ncbi:MAG: S-formylglutathione hydrolase, partial [Woeseiaceae bacterium]|nr:S-formylglutathione hydrolase [Woeseiaceae bacterium]